MMEKRGLYVWTVAFAAIVIITVASVSMVSTVKEHEHKSYANAIVDAKWQSQNAEHLIGKSVSDALADDGYLNPGCEFDLDSIKNTIGYAGSGYLSQTLGESLKDCSVEVVDVSSFVPNELHVEINIECLEDDPGTGLQYKYRKTAIQFNKRVTYTNGTDCSIDVQDIDSEECEVDKIPEPNPGNGCDS